MIFIMIPKILRAIRSPYEIFIYMHPQALILKSLLGLFLITIASSCSRYTGPSPLDGKWKVSTVRYSSDHQYPFSTDQEVYWDFLNVLYKVSGPDYSEWGNAYFHRDSLVLVKDKSLVDKKSSRPIPVIAQGDTVGMRYRVWGKSLKLFGEGFEMTLTRH